MPIYEYECPTCGRFDVLQKMSAPVLETHDVCGSKIRKLMSASAFSFKGSGFYITDYGGKSPAHVSAGDAPEPKAAKGDACASCPAAKG
jgi:putative FmdB family regulatory protein